MQTVSTRCPVLWCSGPEHATDVDHTAYSAEFRPAAAGSTYESVTVWCAVAERGDGDSSAPRFYPPAVHVASPRSTALTPAEARQLAELLHRAACTAQLISDLWGGEQR